MTSSNWKHRHQIGSDVTEPEVAQTRCHYSESVVTTQLPDLDNAHKVPIYFRAYSAWTITIIPTAFCFCFTEEPEHILTVLKLRFNFFRVKFSTRKESWISISTFLFVEMLQKLYDAYCGYRVEHKVHMDNLIQYCLSATFNPQAQNKIRTI